MAGPVAGAQLEPGPIAMPADALVSVATYGAVGDGRTDDTAALQRALADGRDGSDAFGRPKALYFPPGTYLVSDTLGWDGCCVTLQGAGSATSVIRLAPRAAGFGNPAQPKPVIRTPAGNMSFRQNVRDLAIVVGDGNPGAIGLDYVTSNSGTVRNVEIRSEDGAGVSGLAMTRAWPGPLLVKHLAVTGFDVGIDVDQAEYGPTVEHVTLRAQRVAGVRNRFNTLALRELRSDNRVPAVVNRGGFVILMQAELTGGDASQVAVDTDSTLYARAVTASGYRATLLDSRLTPAVTFSGPLEEHLAGAATSLQHPLRAHSLKLEIARTPEPLREPAARWAPFRPSHYGDTRGLQALFDSGSATLYFPFGTYLAFDERVVRVPAHVRRVVGFGSVINGDGAGVNGGGIVLVVDGDGEPLVIEQFGYGLKVEHRGARPVVLAHGGYVYRSALGAGPLFLEDVELAPLAVQPGQSVWARQLNIEDPTTKIRNAGSLWLFGLKTEAAGTVIDTAAGGRTELLGTLLYPSRSVPAADVALRSVDAQVSYLYTQPVYCTGCGYNVQVSETVGASTKRLTTDASRGFRMPLFVGFPPRP